MKVPILIFRAFLTANTQIAVQFKTNKLFPIRAVDALDKISFDLPWRYMCNDASQQALLAACKPTASFAKEAVVETTEPRKANAQFLSCSVRQPNYFSMASRVQESADNGILDLLRIPQKNTHRIMPDDSNEVEDDTSRSTKKHSSVRILRQDYVYYDRDIRDAVPRTPLQLTKNLRVKNVVTEI